MSEATSTKACQGLPLDIIPQFYDISLKPDLIKFEFSGTVKIHATVKNATNVIILNQYELDITHLEILQLGHQTNKKLIETYEFDDTEEKLSIKLREFLTVGEVIEVVLQFKAKYNDSMKGFFTYPYISDDGCVKYATATRFKPTYARRCFPCWDEPSFKAVFKIAISVPKGITALSNMPLESTCRESDETTLCIFQNTPKMSTYLLNVVTGDFDYLEDKTVDNIEIKVYMPKGKRDHGRFALEEMTKSLPYYSNYLNVPYPMPKLDCVALPDLIIPSTGNWGLVTFRTSCLLVDPESNSSRYELSKRLLISHRLAQQWFGNLVTVKKWSDFCVYKGLASFTEYACLDRMYPDNNTWQQFITEEFQKAIDYDSSKDRTAIVSEIENPEELEYVYDEVLCSKACSLIRMLEYWMGEKDFREGLHLYLTKYCYDSATIDELWHCLESVSGKPVHRVMSTWTCRPGYPILKVEQKQQGRDRILSISQQNFVESSEHVWMIPFHVKASSDPDTVVVTTIISERKTQLVVPNVPEDAWIKVNPSTVGFYRTLYSQDMLNAFAPFIRDRTMSPLVRFGFLDDLFYSSKAGHVSLGEVLKFLQEYYDEDNYIVWEIIAKCLTQIGALLCHLPIIDRFKQFCRQFYRNIYKKVGWLSRESDSHLETLLRSLIIGKMALLNDETSQEEARRFFKLDLEGKSPLPSHMKTRVYFSVISSGDEQSLNDLLDLYDRTELYEEKRKILSTLAVVNDRDLLDKVLKLSISEDMGEQDTLVVFSVYSSCNNFVPNWSREMAYQFIKDNWQIFIAHFYEEEYIFAMIKWVTEGFMTDQMLADVQLFFEEYVNPLYDLPVNDCVNAIQSNIDWLNRDQHSIEEFLNNL